MICLNVHTIANKIMKDSLQNENSFIFDRSWQTVNPNQEQLVSLEQARQFLLLLLHQHHELRKLKESDLKELQPQEASQRVESFILKFIQQKQVAQTSRRELPHINKTTYKLSLNDCLQVWRWLSQDSSSFKEKFSNFQDQMSMNEFDLEKNNDNLELKRQPQMSSNSKRVFNQLSLQQQEKVLKKSLQMVYMYYHQFKIIFNHYCKFIIQNEHKRTFTFDDVSHSLEVLTINRFMLFCRQFDIIKTIQFKRRNEQKSSISKDMLTKIFKKNSYLQKYMNLDNFLISLINIALKLHENFDPRSYMHIELFLNSLKVKYYEQFVRKLQYLKIKYSPSQFYNCYKHIFNTHKLLKKKDNYSSVFNNPYFTNQNDKNSNDNPESLSNYTKQPSLQGKNMRSSHSVPSLLIQKQQNHSVINFKASKTLQKRKVSVPILPSIENNRFFKPLEHNHHLNNYQKYLQKVQDTSSVFKNRITGYSQVNNLKNKAFHMKQDNELPISKTDFELMLEKKKEDAGKQLSLASSNIIQQSIITSNQSERITQPIKPQSQLQPIFRQYEESSEKKEIVEGLKQKINVREDDQLLNKHLVSEKLKQDPNNRLNQIFARQLTTK